MSGRSMVLPETATSPTNFCIMPHNDKFSVAIHAIRLSAVSWRIHSCGSCVEKRVVRGCFIFVLRTALNDQALAVCASKRSWRARVQVDS